MPDPLPRRHFCSSVELVVREIDRLPPIDKLTAADLVAAASRLGVSAGRLLIHYGLRRV